MRCAWILAWLFLGLAQPQAEPARGETSSTGERAATPATAIAVDGAALPLTHWAPAGAPEVVVLGLHGFNDFSESFASLAETLTAREIAFYAYDQRGFGATEQRGQWVGRQRLVDDAVEVASQLRERYPEAPLYLLGESMGAAISILALTGGDRAPVDGAVLMSPAVWGLTTQPWYHRLGLWLGEQLVPQAELRSDWVPIEPSDDPETLDYWENHPLVIRSPRLDALVGVSQLMDAALEASAELHVRSLILYGGRDEVVPPQAICLMLQSLPETQPWRFVYYPRGWHFLARDSRAHQTHRDIAAWLHDPDARLPSGLERTGSRIEQAVCNR